MALQPFITLGSSKLGATNESTKPAPRQLTSPWPVPDTRTADSREEEELAAISVYMRSAHLEGSRRSRGGWHLRAVGHRQRALLADDRRPEVAVIALHRLGHPRGSRPCCLQSAAGLSLSSGSAPGHSCAAAGATRAPWPSGGRTSAGVVVGVGGRGCPPRPSGRGARREGAAPHVRWLLHAGKSARLGHARLATLLTICLSALYSLRADNSRAVRTPPRAEGDAAASRGAPAVRASSHDSARYLCTRS